MVERAQRLVFGEVAGDYEAARAPYPARIAELVYERTGGPVPAVEVGAGTGKATALFAPYRQPLTCLEPDPAMAGVLAARSAGQPWVRVLRCGFEEWPEPDRPVPLIYAAQSWHWVDPAVRWVKAARVLSPGGVLALFGHDYAVADPAVEDRLREVYRQLAAELLDDPDERPTTAQEEWLHREMLACGLFTGVSSRLLDRVVHYPTGRYLALLSTFSNHRMLAEQRRAALLGGVARCLGDAGVRLRLNTVLTVGRASAG